MRPRKTVKEEEEEESDDFEDGDEEWTPENNVHGDDDDDDGDDDEGSSDDFEAVDPDLTARLNSRRESLASQSQSQSRSSSQSQSQTRSQPRASQSRAGTRAKRAKAEPLEADTDTPISPQKSGSQKTGGTRRQPAARGKGKSRETAAERLRRLHPEIEDG